LIFFVVVIVNPVCIVVIVNIDIIIKYIPVGISVIAVIIKYIPVGMLLLLLLCQQPIQFIVVIVIPVCIVVIVNIEYIPVGITGEVPLIATFISKYITGTDRRARLDASFNTRYAVKYHFFAQILTPRGAQTSLIY
jgi:hypothetical protein